MANDSMRVAGIDTGKAWLDVAVPGGAAPIRLANTPDGHAELLAWLRGHGVVRVGLEASGGYERQLVRALRRAGFDVVVFQPAQVRAYAQFRLRRAKTDAIDAALIAACTAAAEIGRPIPDPRLEPLAEHLTLIEQIEEDLVRAKTRREGFQEPRQQKLLEREIARLKLARARELKALETRLRRHPDLARRLDLVLSVPGVAARTALALILRMPELGTLSREEAASLAGLAPFDDSSGQRDGQRRIAGGRARVRKSLYAAALPAAFRWNEALVALYRRLTQKGKPHKLALIACARKLLLFVNTVLTRGTQWQTKTAPQI